MIESRAREIVDYHGSEASNAVNAAFVAKFWEENGRMPTLTFLDDGDGRSAQTYISSKLLDDKNKKRLQLSRKKAPSVLLQIMDEDPDDVDGALPYFWHSRVLADPTVYGAFAELCLVFNVVYPGERAGPASPLTAIRAGWRMVPATTRASSLAASHSRM